MRYPVLAFFERSLRIESRSGAMCWARICLLGMIFLQLFSMESMARSGLYGAPGLHVFEKIVWGDFAFISLAGLGYFASAITEEKEEMMLGLLRMTDLSPVGILLGKSTNRLFGALLLLAVQFPFTLLAVTLGGVSALQIVAVYCTLLAFIFFLCNVALFFSVAVRRSALAAFLTGLVFFGFFTGSYIAKATVDGWIATYLINPQQGIWPLVNTVIGWWREASPIEQIEKILQTGFADSPIGLQVISNMVFGVAAFLLAWLIFDVCTREQKEEAPVRAPLLRRATRASRIPAHIVGPAAITWKDSTFSGGGQFGWLLKFILIGVLIGGIDLLIAFTMSAGGDHMTRQFFGASVSIISLIIMGVLLAFEASRIFKAEVRWKTLSSLVTLPISIREMAYRKIAGVLLGVVPIFIYFVLGFVVAPENLGDTFANIFRNGDGFAAFIFALLQGILFLHLVAYFSLVIKRGALPLTVMIHWGGVTFLTIPFAMLFGASSNATGGLLVMIFLTLVMICFTHVAIGNRLARAAAEE